MPGKITHPSGISPTPGSDSPATETAAAPRDAKRTLGGKTTRHLPNHDTPAVKSLVAGLNASRPSYGVDNPHPEYMNPDYVPSWARNDEAAVRSYPGQGAGQVAGDGLQTDLDRADARMSGGARRAKTVVRTLSNAASHEVEGGPSKTDGLSGLGYSFRMAVDDAARKHGGPVDDHQIQAQLGSQQTQAEERLGVLRDQRDGVLNRLLTHPNDRAAIAEYHDLTDQIGKLEMIRTDTRSLAQMMSQAHRSDLYGDVSGSSGEGQGPSPEPGAPVLEPGAPALREPGAPPREPASTPVKPDALSKQPFAGLTNSGVDCFANAALQQVKVDGEAFLKAARKKHGKNHPAVKKLDEFVNGKKDGSPWTDRDSQQLRKELYYSIINENVKRQPKDQRADHLNELMGQDSYQQFFRGDGRINGRSSAQQDSSLFYSQLSEWAGYHSMQSTSTITYPDGQATYPKRTDVALQPINASRNRSGQLDMQSMVDDAFSEHTLADGSNGQHQNSLQELPTKPHFPIARDAGRGLDRRQVTFENAIQLTDVNGNQAQYQPKSITCHFGRTSNSGHYVQFSQESDGWYLHNDDSRQKIDLDEQAPDFIGYDSNQGLTYRELMASHSTNVTYEKIPGTEVNPPGAPGND